MAPPPRQGAKQHEEQRPDDTVIPVEQRKSAGTVETRIAQLKTNLFPRAGSEASPGESTEAGGVMLE